MIPGSESIEHFDRQDEHGERWDTIAHSNPDQPEGDVGATVRRFVRSVLADSYEFSFDRGRDGAGTVYRALPFRAPPGRLQAGNVNRARYEAGTVIAEATGARVSVGPIFSQPYLDSLPEGAEAKGEGARGEAAREEHQSPSRTNQRGGCLGLTDEQLRRFRLALQDVTEALEARDQKQDTLEELEDGQLTRIAGALDTALEILDEAAEQDGERPSIAG